ncbi:MAG: GAF domain-containing protein [Anaerolineae bacterium]
MKKVIDTAIKLTRLPQALADQAAMAVRSARLLEELERRLHETNTLFEVSRHIVTTLDLDTVLEAIVDAALKTIPTAQKAVIHFVEGTRLVPRAASPRQLGLPSALLRVGVGVAGHAVQEKSAIYVPDASQDARFLDTGSGVRSLIVVPVMVGEQVIGTLSVDSSQIEAFTPDDERLLKMLANQAAIAIQNARLFSATQRLYESESRRARQLAFLNEVGRTITSTLNLNDVLNLILVKVMDILDVEASSLLLLDEEKDELVFKVSLGPGQKALVGTRLSLEKGIAGTVVREGCPLIVNDVLSDPRWSSEQDLLTGLTTRSILCVPLVSRERVIGALELVNKRNGQPFQEDEVDLLSSLASQATIAIENARLYEELKEIDRMKSSFLSTAAHELRTPLTSIRGFSELLLVRKDIGPEERQQFLEFIHKQAVALTRLVDDLLDLSRIESGRGFHIAAEPVDMSQVIEENVRIFSEQSAIHSYRIVGPEKWPVLIGDKDKLSQVMRNLLSNATKYSPQGGEVVIEARNKEGYLEISVSDQGIGMSAEQVARIFEKFYRGDASNTAIEGTGLGMVIVRHIVEGHGGKIWVESEQGVGTTVTFVLPLPDRQSAILIIEDDECTMDVESRLLSEHGYRIFQAKDWKEALALASENHPDLILLDMLLPAMSVERVLEILKRQPRTADIPVIITSARSIEVDIERAYRAGAVDYLAKPFESVELLARVRKALERRRSEIRAARRL